MTQAAAPRPVRFQEFAAGEVAGADYLIKRFLARGTHAVFYGAPGAGKTFAVLNMAYHIAAGLEWMGKRVRQAPVIYLAFEGIGGMKARAKALAQHYGDADVPLWIVPATFDLTDKASLAALLDMLALMGERPGLIVIDTLARAMPGKDENSAQDMGALNAAVAALIEATGACVLLVHHQGKQASKGARGSSALLGAIDTEVLIAPGVIGATKQRDVELGPDLYFALKPIMVGMDSDGEAITSCVVVPAAPPAKVQQSVFEPTFDSDEYARAWDILGQLTGDTNEAVQGDVWEKAWHAAVPPVEGGVRFRNVLARFVGDRYAEALDLDGKVLTVDAWKERRTRKAPCQYRRHAKAAEAMKGREV